MMNSQVGHNAQDFVCSAVFPQIDSSYILAFQFSSWFPIFSSISIRSTIIRPLESSFKDYLEADGVFVPVGSEDVAAESTLSDDKSECSDASEPEFHIFTFPELDARIRAAVVDYQGIFPKLNFSSPKDAAWILPMSSPLKCTSPADVYLLLKSSNFVTHDLSAERVFNGCGPNDQPSYELELVLRKWYPVDRSREIRCFVRNDTLLGITQRDMNFYNYMADRVTQTSIKSTVRRLWEENIRPKWTLTQPDYVFDLLLSRDLSRGHVLDFNPYVPRTDPLLFSYEELHALFVRVACGHDQPPNGSKVDLPEFRVVDSPMHHSITRNAPAHQHNMVPIEALNLSDDKSVIEFSEVWRYEVQRAMQEDEDDATLKTTN